MRRVHGLVELVVIGCLSEATARRAFDSALVPARADLELASSTIVFRRDKCRLNVTPAANPLLHGYA